MEPQEVIEETEENINGVDEIEDDVVQNEKDSESVPDYEDPLRKYLLRIKEK